MLTLKQLDKIRQNWENYGASKTPEDLLYYSRECARWIPDLLQHIGENDSKLKREFKTIDTPITC